MIKKSMKLGKQAGGFIWELARSEKSLAIIKVAATFAAFVHSIEEFRKSKRQIGFHR
jgi:hypothetical protein